MKRFSLRTRIKEGCFPERNNNRQCHPLFCHILFSNIRITDLHLILSSIYKLPMNSRDIIYCSLFGLDYDNEMVVLSVVHTTSVCSLKTPLDKLSGAIHLTGSFVPLFLAV